VRVSCHPQRRRCNTSLRAAMREIPRCTDPLLPAGEALTTQAAMTRLPPSAPPGLPASVVPPTTFGRRAHDAPAGSRPRTLAVRLDDPAATARSLRAHMEPADFMKLIIFLAEAAADVLRKRNEDP
jgi:hypothetical protein